MRNLRGDRGNERHGETVTPPRKSKERERKPLTYSEARHDPTRPLHESAAGSAPSLGFEDTGEVVSHGERVMVLSLLQSN